MNFDETEEFSKDFKRLSRKYKSLADDLLEFKKVVSKFPLGTGKHFVILIEKETVKIIKGRLFYRYLKGSSLRIIYAYCENKQKVEFIQLYFKGDKENGDHNKIKNYLRNFKQHTRHTIHVNIQRLCHLKVYSFIQRLCHPPLID